MGVALTTGYELRPATSGIGTVQQCICLSICAGDVCVHSGIAIRKLNSQDSLNFLRGFKGKEYSILHINETSARDADFDFRTKICIDGR